ncbi:prolyl oligopeptidase family serine peptidase [Paludisphaera mucosa]|uniref:Prolyl oligopeptidase family serine peptidase n=1 Tax=Paludisphaera mucosa TaxID=3030827 RepID=A0ABT6FBN4_9BACT|nr:prolyl oligopeptidase family serine peptidase [Paludisphaera mucosa]MDG3004977.1 prolyl oligopeptidase family serine peptidase [Paludisphaera mucosa]
MFRRRPTLLLMTLLLAAAASAAEPIEVREGLVLPGGRRGRREAIPADPIVARIVAGTWTPPRAGEAAALGDDRERKWEPVQAQADGFPTPPGSYLAIDAVSPDDRVVILEASGHGAVYVGDEPHTGDPYATGYVRIPIKLRKGSNPLLFLGGRGRSIPVKFTPPKAAALLNTGDATTPDLLDGEPLEADAAVVVLNATDEIRDGLAIVSRVDGGPEVRTPVPLLPPFATRKVRFAIKAEPRSGTTDRPLVVQLVEGETTLDEATIPLRSRRPEQDRKRTFLSAIDGSIQYYGHVPAAADAAGGRPGLILTLHGASVEGIGQAAAYRPKPGLHVVAPTNRRPYGFDWEDWGRKDAIEVLETTSELLGVDPRRTYLTGHSMGGHGTWHLGVTYPDRFAAIAPSAGWVSMFSYAGATRPDAPDPVDELIARAANPSDTLGLVRNLAGLGVYVLHGDADDNVPVAQARTMRERLAAFQPDFAYYERPGAGHWWGNECVDWPPLIAYLREHELKPVDQIRRVDFVTMSPGVSARSGWATIEAQAKAMRPSAIHLAFDPEKRRLEGTTENVARLTLGVSAPPIDVVLDGQTLSGVARVDAPGAPRILLARSKEGAWSTLAAPASPALKGPNRSGPFKEAFNRRFVLVYGTTGTPEENALSLARARYDAEVFWYRGNGSVDVVADVAFLHPPLADAFRDRSVVLYGQIMTNAAWRPLLGEGPVQVDRGVVRVGDREVKGDDLACLFIRPRPGSDVASVGVVAGTGARGMRLSATLPYFVSGTGFPDLAIVRGGDGARPPHAVAAGYFGEDWGVDSGEFAWRD